MSDQEYVDYQEYQDTEEDYESDTEEQEPPRQKSRYQIYTENAQRQRQLESRSRSQQLSWYKTCNARRKQTIADNIDCPELDTFVRQCQHGRRCSGTIRGTKVSYEPSTGEVCIHTNAFGTPCTRHILVGVCTSSPKDMYQFKSRIILGMHRC